MPKQQRIRIGILARAETAPSTLFGLYDVLSSVGVGWETNVAGSQAESRFDVRIVAATQGPLQYAGGVVVNPHAGVEESSASDVAIVSSVAIPAWARPRCYDESELDWIRRHQVRGAIVASTCTGTIVLAASGVLDGWEATTHWAYQDLFRVYYPRVKLRPDRNLCVSGHDNQIVTSGGTTAWSELAMHLIVRFCGIDYAKRAAKYWLIADKGESQAPYSALSRGVPHEDAIVKRCQVWFSSNFVETNPVSRMVRNSGLPQATFARRFKRATGYRPMDYVHALRVEVAKEMLETSAHAVDEIGHEVGYEDPASFRRIFKRKTKMTPAAYRRQFGKARFRRYELAR